MSGCEIDVREISWVIAPEVGQLIGSVGGAEPHPHPVLAADVAFLHDLPLIIVFGGAAVAYVVAARRVSREHPTQPWSRGRTAAFLTGVALALLVTIGPVGAQAMDRFSVHMVQHLALMMLATPLLVIGAPVLLILRRVRPEVRRLVWVPFLRSTGFRVITNPILTWLVFAATLVGVHFTPAMSWLMDAGYPGHLIEIALYVTVAFLYYYPLLPGNPCPGRPKPAFRVASLFLMMVPETMTGFFLYVSGAPLIPHFADMAGALDLDALSDQRLGGALMWSTSMIIDVGWLAVAVAEWFDSEAKRTKRMDSQLAADATAEEGPR